MKRTKLEVSTYSYFKRFKEYTFIGEGAEAKVYSDGQYAYKRCLTRSAYLKWIDKLEEHKLLTSRHVPKIYEIFYDKSKKWCVIKMELLKMHPNEDISREHSRKFSQIIFDSHKAKQRSGIAKIAYATFDLMKDHPIDLDMHHNNVMYRKNQYKTPVITDPVLGDDW